MISCTYILFECFYIHTIALLKTIFYFLKTIVYFLLAFKHSLVCTSNTIKCFFFVNPHEYSVLSGSI